VIQSSAAVHAEWGSPQSVGDLTAFFVRYLRGEAPSTPFSPTPLSPESKTILEPLERLTAAGCWTVGSQPAVDGAPSTDPVVGWGPRGGRVFQKAFVEFFAEEEVVERLERRVRDYGGGLVDFFAANEQV
jgi:methylenetetrahydrofolate reductase (NADPH)